MTVNVIKFSQFATADLTKMNSVVGFGNGVNFQMPDIVTWTTSGRPSPPQNGIIGFNSTFTVYEYWNGTIWVSIGNGTGSVTSVATGNGLTGGPITSTGTISLVAPVSVSNGGTGLTTTANNAGFFTNNSGVPSWVAATGNGPPVLQTGAIINSPIILTGLYDTNNNPFIVPVPTLNAVNYLHVINNSTGNPVQIEAAGSDTNIIMSISGKGSGGVQLQGTNAGGNAPSGYVGEVISSQVLFASAITLTTSGTSYDITSIALTAGDWDVFGNFFVFSSANTATAIAGWIGTSPATPIDNSLISKYTGTVFTVQAMPVPQQRINVTGSQTVYLSVNPAFTSTAPTACGQLYARRVR